MLKLGRKAVVTDSRTLKVSKYLLSELPPPPASVNYSKGVTNFGMLGNDVYGDCTIAGLAHGIEVWTLDETGKMATITEAEALHYYEAWDGYVAGDPSTDNGGIMLNCLRRFKKNGFAGHKLDAFATVLPATTEHVQQAIYLFGGLYIGMDVPAYIMPSDGNVPLYWDLDPKADNSIIGGHAVWVFGYNATSVQFASWDGVYSMSWPYWARFVDESYSLLSPDWFSANGEAPNGFWMKQLRADLVQIN